MKNAKKIIITEFGSWHDECLYSLCMLLKQNSYYIILIANESLRKKNGQNLASVTDEIIYYPFGSTLKGFIALWKFYLYLSLIHISRELSDEQSENREDQLAAFFHKRIRLAPSCFVYFKETIFPLQLLERYSAG